MDLDWKDEWFTGESTTTSPSWNLAPKTNRCYVFPSWLEHKVYMNETDKTRISIALNTTIVKKVDDTTRKNTKGQIVI